LIMYYFLVGSFFFYGLRMVKRASNTIDQLFGVTLLAAVASHFVEIQTGIQIASTWTYFYLIIGMMVAFGYYMNNYLRPVGETEAIAAPQNSNRRSVDGADVVVSEEMESEARPVAVAAGARAGSDGGRATATMQATGNGKSQSTGQNTRRMQSGASTVATSQNRGAQPQGNRSGGTPDGRKPRTSVQYNANRGTSKAAEWTGNPVMLVLYGVVALIALLFIWTVNAANVQADTLFKQAQAYDQATRFFLERDTNGVEYPGSISYYDKALALQPNQDYYYLFEGRAYLEAAKSVDQEPYNRRLAGVPGSDPRWSEDPATAQQQKTEEKLFRLRKSEEILSRANQMSPYNTDHYANLGRLYLYWADSTGAGDASKAPLAVQWMEQATQHTPGNAQLWFELAVAYSRDNRFDDAIAATYHSEELDPTYGRPALVRGQLYQERAEIVQNALINGQPLPTDGEVDYGKLVVEAGKAFSDTAYTDPTQVVDTQYQPRVDFLVNAAKPFTNTNTTLTQEQLSNVITDTLMQGLERDIARQELDLGNRVRNRGVAVLGERVDDNTLQALWANPDWSNGQPDGTGDWLTDEVRLPATRAALDHYGLGVIYATLGDKAKATAEYNRALLLRPGFSEAATALQELEKLP
jgi:tetratricopeptide (TPR) repeat protein